MSLNCYIVDDEPHAIEVLKRYIENTPGLTLSGSDTNPLLAVTAILDGQPPDITFLDIDMPQLNGLAVADLVGSVTSIIFTTSFRQHAPEAFEKDAADYLLKPITFDRFLNSVNKVRKILKGREADRIKYPSYFFVKSGIKGKFTRIVPADIRYVENVGNYIYIYTTREKIAAYLTLNDILTKLPDADFSRIHQSFIINHHFISSVEYNQVRLSEQLALPVGATYRQVFRQKLLDHLLLSKRESQV